MGREELLPAWPLCCWEVTCSCLGRTQKMEPDAGALPSPGPGPGYFLQDPRKAPWRCSFRTAFPPGTPRLCLKLPSCLNPFITGGWGEGVILPQSHAAHVSWRIETHPKDTWTPTLTLETNISSIESRPTISVGWMDHSWQMVRRGRLGGLFFRDPSCVSSHQMAPWCGCWSRS